MRIPIGMADLVQNRGKKVHIASRGTGARAQSKPV